MAAVVAASATMSAGKRLDSAAIQAAAQRAVAAATSSNHQSSSARRQTTPASAPKHAATRTNSRLKLRRGSSLKLLTQAAQAFATSDLRSPEAKIVSPTRGAVAGGGQSGTLAKPSKWGLVRSSVLSQAAITTKTAGEATPLVTKPISSSSGVTGPAQEGAYQVLAGDATLGAGLATGPSRQAQAVVPFREVFASCDSFELCCRCCDARCRKTLGIRSAVRHADGAVWRVVLMTINSIIACALAGILLEVSWDADSRLFLEDHGPSTSLQWAILAFTLLMQLQLAEFYWHLFATKRQQMAMERDAWEQQIPSRGPWQQSRSTVKPLRWWLLPLEMAICLLMPLPEGALGLSEKAALLVFLRLYHILRLSHRCSGIYRNRQLILRASAGVGGATRRHVSSVRFDSLLSLKSLFAARPMLFIAVVLGATYVPLAFGVYVQEREAPDSDYWTLPTSFYYIAAVMSTVGADTEPRDPVARFLTLLAFLVGVTITSLAVVVLSRTLEPSDAEALVFEMSTSFQAKLDADEARDKASKKRVGRGGDSIGDGSADRSTNERVSNAGVALIGGRADSASTVDAGVAGSVTGVELYQAQTDLTEPASSQSNSESSSSLTAVASASPLVLSPRGEGVIDASTPTITEVDGSDSSSESSNGKRLSQEDDDDEDDVTELSGSVDDESLFLLGVGSTPQTPPPPRTHESLTPTGRASRGTMKHRFGRFPNGGIDASGTGSSAQFESRRRFASTGSAGVQSRQLDTADTTPRGLRHIRSPSDTALPTASQRMGAHKGAVVAVTSGASSPSADGSDYSAIAAAVAANRLGTPTQSRRASVSAGDDDSSSMGGSTSNGGVGGGGGGAGSGESLPFDLPVRLLMRSVIERLDDLEAGQTDAARILDSVTDRLATIATALAAVDKRQKKSTARVVADVHALSRQVAAASDDTKLALQTLARGVSDTISDSSA